MVSIMLPGLLSRWLRCMYMFLEMKEGRKLPLLDRSQRLNLFTVSWGGVRFIEDDSFERGSRVRISIFSVCLYGYIYMYVGISASLFSSFSFLSFPLSSPSFFFIKSSIFPRFIKVAHWWVNNPRSYGWRLKWFLIVFILLNVFYTATHSTHHMAHIECYCHLDEQLHMLLLSFNCLPLPPSMVPRSICGFDKFPRAKKIRGVKKTKASDAVKAGKKK